MTKDEYSAKQVACPVHGTIGLSQLELDLLETKAFQRLRNVKQLGLAHYVFPGADFSRLSHSLGVCHITGLFLRHLVDIGTEIDNDEMRHFRVAALIHDLGHYPFSHPMESALEALYPGPEVAAVEGVGAQKQKSKAERYHHEDLSALVFERDPEIKDVLKRHGKEVDVGIVLRILQGKEPSLSNLVKSDLDADQLDYLLRTAIHSGLPYGQIDLDYLISQMVRDKEDRLCFLPKALNAVDHCLLGRYFDRMTVAYHKTVAGFELLLQKVISDLVSEGELKATKKDIEDRIDGGQWAEFDDSFIVGKMRNVLEKKPAADLRERIDAILHRRPLRVITQLEYLSDRNDQSFVGQEETVKAALSRWQEESKLSFWDCWSKGGFTLTSLGGMTPITIARKLTPQDLEESAHILVAKDEPARPVQEVERSLMRVLSQEAYYALRVYALVPDQSKETVTQLRKMLKADLKDPRWQYLSTA